MGTYHIYITLFQHVIVAIFYDSRITESIAKLFYNYLSIIAQYSYNFPMNLITKKELCS